MTIASRVDANYRQVLERIAAAAKRAGRDPRDVRLVAVTKYAQLDWIRALLDLGHTDLGENRPQQLVERADAVPAAASPGNPIRWHLIGHLQRNKVRKVLPIVGLIHSIDSLRLLAEISRIASELQFCPRVLVEVNLIADPNKHGFSWEELVSSWDALTAVPHVEIIGLMAMAAEGGDPELSRPTFAALRRLRDELAAAGPRRPLPDLSMGMSGDYEVAVEEGATLVRIGSALWEGLSLTA